MIETNVVWSLKKTGFNSTAGNRRTESEILKRRHGTEHELIEIILSSSINVY